MWKLQELKYSGLHLWHELHLVSVPDLEHMHGQTLCETLSHPCVGDVPPSLLCPTADSRNQLHSCFL